MKNQSIKEQEIQLEREIDNKVKEGRDLQDNFMLQEQQRRKQEVIDRIELLKQEKELKKKEMQEHARRVLGTHKKGSPKYKELERKFIEQVEMEDLET